MNEKIKKIGKILLIIIGVLVVLGVAGSIILNVVSRNMSVLPETDYYDGDYAISDEIGLGSSASPLSLFKSSGRSTSQSNVNRNNSNEGELTKKKIIKNGDLSLYVKDAETAAKEIQSLAKSLGGFVSESRISQSSSGVKSGNVTIRVPVNNFEKAMNNAKQLAVEVEREYITAQDVTEQYIDYEAQLKNLRAEETQYQEIMAKSFTINDTLQVSNRLSDVRGRIEMIQGKLKYLSRQIDMSTIQIRLAADDDVKVFGLRWRPLIVLKRSFKSMLSGLTDYVDAMIGIVFYIPVIILWFATIIFILIIIWRILKWIYRRFLKGKDKEDVQKLN
jgi:hypothetical protein